MSGLAIRIDGSILPAHELPVEFFAPAESISKANGSSVVASNLGRQATCLGHAVLEDDAANTRVDKRHRAHDAWLVSEEDLQLQAEVAVRLQVVALEVLLFEVVEGKIEEEGVARRLVETKAGDSEGFFALVGLTVGGLGCTAQALSADHANSTHDSVAHGVALAWMIACSLASDISRIGHRLETRVPSSSNNLCLVVNSFHYHAAGRSLRESLVVSLLAGALGQVESIGDAKVANERMLKVALGLGDGAWVSTEWIGLAVEGGPVLLGPLLGLFRLCRRLARDRSLLDLKRKGPGLGVGAEGRVLDHEVVEVRE